METTPIALLIEDEPQIRRFVRSALENEGWTVHETDRLQRGLIESGTRKPDLIILDLGLPDGDGLTFVREFRNWSSAPIIVLSARVTEQDKIDALDAGADDYLTKPFGTGELLARIRAAWRRRSQAPSNQSNVIRFGDVEIHLDQRQISRGGSIIHLTPTEYRLLSVLIRHANRVVTTPQLLKEVWGPTHVEHSHYVRVYMGHLRQKLEADPTQPVYLQTETAVGYRLVLDA